MRAGAPCDDDGDVQARVEVRLAVGVVPADDREVEPAAGNAQVGDVAAEPAAADAQVDAVAPVVPRLEHGEVQRMLLHEQNSVQQWGRQALVESPVLRVLLLPGEFPGPLVPARRVAFVPVRPAFLTIAHPAV